MTRSAYTVTAYTVTACCYHSQKAGANMTLRSTVKPLVPAFLRPIILSSISRVWDVLNRNSATRLERGLVRLGNEQRVARRRAFAMNYYNGTLALIERWSASNSEDSNFLYAISPLSKQNLSHILAIAFDSTPSKVRALFSEIENDNCFQQHISTELRKYLPGASVIDIGRRLGWYAVARVTKPKVIVETGVDFGLGSCVMCAALLRNRVEGFPGRYIGTELRKEAGQLLLEPYSSTGEIRFGDSIETLSQMTETIDLFINDSDHSIEYEAKEYETIKDRLSKKAVILGDNSHFSPALADFSERNSRKFIFFKEDPVNHWYPGAGIGISFLG